MGKLTIYLIDGGTRIFDYVVNVQDDYENIHFEIYKKDDIVHKYTFNKNNILGYEHISIKKKIIQLKKYIKDFD